jgi:hypothetical protein
MKVAVKSRVPQKEKAIQKTILDWLEARGYICVKVNNGGIKKPNGSFIPPRRKGVADIIACSPSGRFLAIEVKRKGGIATKEQKAFLNDIDERNGIGMIVYSFAELERSILRYEQYGL